MSYYFTVKLVAKICLLRGRDYQLCDRLGDYLKKRTLNDSCSELNGKLRKRKNKGCCLKISLAGFQVQVPKHQFCVFCAWTSFDYYLENISCESFFACTINILYAALHTMHLLSNSQL